MANGADPDDIAHYELFHLDLQFAQVLVLVCQVDRVKWTG